jgi:hypothetical protein
MNPPPAAHQTIRFSVALENTTAVIRAAEATVQRRLTNLREVR